MIKSIGIKEVDDENIEILINGKVVAYANHDEDGWVGMEKVEGLVDIFAKALGLNVNRS